jgi:glucose/arabinose dehydrogenase
MTYLSHALALSLSTALLASCSGPVAGDDRAQSTPAASAPADGEPFAIAEMGNFNEPWAAAFAPGTPVLFVTEKAGAIEAMDTNTGRMITVSGTPQVDYGGQGGLGDIAFLETESNATLDRRTIYLSWAEAGSGDTRGAVLGRGQLVCEEADACAIEDLDVIWRQSPKVTGRGHYSHRIAFSPDGQYIFLASGDRQKQDPAQDTTNNLGTVLRLNLDGSPAAGNPLASEGGVSRELWSWGHRNILGMEFDSEGRLWVAEHGPAGGDELNLVQRATNYGWPVVSNGDNYNGTPIPDNDTRPEFEKPVVGWTPVIAPGSMTFVDGDMFSPWRGDLLIAGLKTKAIIRVEMDGDEATEVARYDMGTRLREIVEGPDGAIWVLEDGENGRLFKLTR